MGSRFKTISLAALIFLLNIYICHELFRIEYLRFMYSIEGVFIGISHYATGHWRDLSWFSPWYEGIPYQDTYPPLLHLCVAAVAMARGVSAALAYHWTTALAYCLGPVTLFALVLRFTRSRWAAFAAAAFYSATSVSAWLMPAVRHDLGSALFPRRLQALVYYGEGPNVSAMTLLPLAILALDWWMTRRRAPQFVLATLAMAAAVVINWLATFSFALMVAAYMIARLGSKGWKRDLAGLALMSAAAYALVCPWIPPSTIALVRHNAQFNGGDFRSVYSMLPVWAAIAVLSIAGLKWLTRRGSVGAQFAVLFAFLMALIVLTNEWFHRAIVPQPGRYHLEMEMAFAILLGVAVHSLFRNRSRRVVTAALALLAIALIVPVRRTRNYARNFLLRDIDIRTTVEWKEADWLNRNWSGQRVLLSSHDTFWLTAFSDIPEVGGGFDQGITDPVVPIALYGVVAWPVLGDHAVEDELVWLKALGAQAFGVPAEAKPQRFDGLLTRLWSDQGNVLFRVGARETPLARVVSCWALVPDRPQNAADIAETKRYVDALDAAPDSSFRWTTTHSARINANLQPGECVSVQIAYHPGWQATVGDRVLKIRPDGLGLMRIDPSIIGAASIDLSYDGGMEMRLAHWLCAISAIALLASVAVTSFKKP